MNAATQNQEIMSWINMLDAMQQQNVALKNLLAEVVRNDTNGVTLEHAEVFLNSILNKEAVIALLRHEVADNAKFPKDDNGRRQAKLQEDILKMESELNRLNTDLLGYLETIGN